MYLQTIQVRSRGKLYTYTRLVESVRRKSDGKTSKKVLAKLGGTGHPGALPRDGRKSSRRPRDGQRCRGGDDRGEPGAGYRSDEVARAPLALQDGLLEGKFGQLSEHTVRAVLKLDGENKQREALETLATDPEIQARGRKLRPRKLRTSAAAPA